MVLCVDALQPGGEGCPRAAGQAAEEGVRHEGGVHVAEEVGRHGAHQPVPAHQGPQHLQPIDIVNLCKQCFSSWYK